MKRQRMVVELLVLICDEGDLFAVNNLKDFMKWNLKYIHV